MKQALSGVNLGGWLVLEPWITPSLFRGQANSAVDEFTFCDEAGSERMRALRQHHKAWITRHDFQWLAEHGFQAVRIPVGYWIFGDVPPYVGSIRYLDKAFAWAEEYGLKVLICLHGAPGSQNGKMHSGRQGAATWPNDKENITQSLRAIERLAQRYKGRSTLLGIEVLNEPLRTIPRQLLIGFYRRAYRIIRHELGPTAWVVFDDRFRPQRWWWVLHWPFYRHAVQDHHHYQAFDPADKTLDVAGHLEKVARIGRTLQRISRHRKIIVGEWSASLDAQSLDGLDPRQRADAYRQYTSAQLAAYRQTDAWFYWTYRTENGGPWSLRSLVEQGLFPVVV